MKRDKTDPVKDCEKEKVDDVGECEVRSDR